MWFIFCALRPHTAVLTEAIVIREVKIKPSLLSKEPMIPIVYYTDNNIIHPMRWGVAYPGSQNRINPTPNPQRPFSTRG